MKRLCKIYYVLIAVVIIASLFSCSKNDTKNKVNFIVDEKGNKMYKNEDGIFVRNDWYEINGGKYYFDGNGYLLTNQWINDEYLVDENGKLVTNYWHEEKGKTYYLGPDGKYYKDDVYKIDGKEYLFDNEGALVKDTVSVDPKNDNKITLIDKRGIMVKDEGLYELSLGKFYVDKDGYVIENGWKKINGNDRYFGELGVMVDNGFALAKDVKKSTDSETQKWCYIKDESGESKIVKNDWVKDAGKWYYAGDDGILLSNEWKKIDDDEYYFKDQCDMAVNEFVDGTYYVDENGKKVKNTTLVLNGLNYTFNGNGQYNTKIIPKQKNSNWQRLKYSNSANYYVTGINYYDTKKFFSYSGITSPNTIVLCRSSIVVDKNDIRIRVGQKLNIDSSYNNDYKMITDWEDNVTVTISVDEQIRDSRKVLYIEDGYLCLATKQEEIFKSLLSTDSNRISIRIEEVSESGSENIYEFSLVSTGFQEVYLSL